MAIAASASIAAHAISGYLTQDEINTFWQQGYVIKKSCVDRFHIHLLDQMTTDVLAKIQQEVLHDKYPYQTEQQIAYINGTQVIFKKIEPERTSILRIVGCGGIEPFFLSALRSHKMVMTFFELLKCEELEHIICQFHPKQPNDGVAFAKHCDIQYRKAFDPEWEDVLGNGSYAISILAIDPMSAKNGGLYVDQGSYPKATGIENVVALNMEPGDLLFMHPNIIHWSERNDSNTSRRILLSGFCAWGANHKTYPGADVNVHLTRRGDRISADPVNWNKQEIETTAGNH